MIAVLEYLEPRDIHMEFELLVLNMFTIKVPWWNSHWRGERHLNQKFTSKYQCFVKWCDYLNIKLLNFFFLSWVAVHPIELMHQCTRIWVQVPVSSCLGRGSLSGEAVLQISLSHSFLSISLWKRKGKQK